MKTATSHSPETFAPRAENYLPEPKFKYAPNQKQIDFAQIIASGGDLVDALSISSLITAQEKEVASRSQLYAMGTRLLSNPAVQERIDYYLLLHKASMSISAERIQQELAAVSFSDFAQVHHKEDGPLVERKNLYHDPEDPNSKETFTEPEWRAGDPIRNPHHIPRHVRAAIKEFHIDKDGIVKVKFHDKLKAKKMLAEMEGYMDESNRAKAPNINISIGDGRGMEPPREPKKVEGKVIEVEPDCLK
jgi:hypothetical protein